MAKNTFANPWIQATPFITRNFMRTCLHAISAADTFISIVDDRTEFSFLKRSNRTDGSTSRLLAVHTIFSGVALTILFYNRKSLFRKVILKEIFISNRKFVLL